MKRRLAIAASLAVLTWGAAAHACDARERDADIARANALRLRGRANEAVGVMQEVATRCPEARVRTQLALAEQSAGRWYEAWQRLNDVLTTRDDTWVEARRPVIQGARDACLPHLAALAPTANAPDAELWVNGMRVGVLPLAAPHVAAPGSFSIELRAPGYSVHRQNVTLGEGESMRTRVTLEVEAPAAPEPVAAPVVTPQPSEATPRATPTLRYVGYGIIVAGVAAGAFGVVQWVRTASMRDSLSAAPYDGEDPYASARLYLDRNAGADGCARASADAARDRSAASAAAVCDDHATARAMALGFGIGGAVLAGVGVALAVSARRAEPSTEARVTLTPWFGAATGAAASVRF